MNNSVKRKKSESVAWAMVTPFLASAILTFLAPSAHAQSFGDVVRNALGTNNNNNPYSTNQYIAGNNGMNAGQTTSINNLNTTRAQANASISTAVANGTLSVDQASLYQNQLNANANEQANYVNSGNFNFMQMQSVLTNLQGINTNITSAIATGATNSFNANTNFNNGNNGWNNGWNNGRRNRGNNRWNNGYNNQINPSYWTGIDSQLSASLNRMQDGLNNRSLTQNEFNDLKRQYDLIVARENQYRASGGRFSNNERSALERQIDSLNLSITHETTDRENNRRGGRWR